MDEKLKELDSFCSLCQAHIDGEANKRQHFAGKKHQRLEHKHKMEERDKHTLYMSGFPRVATKSDIKTFVLSFGRYVNLHIAEENKFIFVQYEDLEVLKKLLDMKLTFMNRVIFVKMKRPQKFMEMREIEKNSEEIIRNLIQSLSNEKTFDCQLYKFLINIQSNRDEYKIKYDKLCRDLQNALNAIFPDCVVYPFGSTLTGLDFIGSDVDAFIKVKPMYLNLQPNETAAAAYVKMAGKHLRKTSVLSFTSIRPIPLAKTPIIKCVHVETKISCDFNFKNMLGVCNTYLINYYLTLDEKLRSLFLIIKAWGKSHDLIKTSKFSSYSLTMMIIFYLQQSYHLPPVRILQHPQAPVNMQEGWNGGFDEHFKVVLKKLPEDNFINLLRGFFTFYEHFQYSDLIISPYLGESLTKCCFSRPETIPASLYQYKVILNKIFPLNVDTVLCVQDPFELNYNITRAINEKTLLDFTWLCRHALKILEKKPCLVRLFEEKPLEMQTVVTGEKCSFVVWKGGKSKYLLKDISEEDKNKGNEIYEGLIEKAWFEAVIKFTLAVLLDVFYIQTSSLEKSKNKSMKLAGQSDVHDNQHIVDSVEFDCIAKINLWNRKIVPKEVFHEKDTILAKQTSKSKYIKEILLNNEEASEPIINFKLKLNAYSGLKGRGTHMDFTIIKKSAVGNAFVEFGEFFTSSLLSWFYTHEKDLNNEIKDIEINETESKVEKAKT